MYYVVCPDCGTIREIVIEPILHEMILACNYCGCIFRPVRPTQKPENENIVITLLLKQGSLKKGK